MVFLLRPIDADGNTVEGIIIRAKDEIEARQVADSTFGSSGYWTDGARASCEAVEEGSAAVLLWTTEPLDC